MDYRLTLIIGLLLSSNSAWAATSEILVTPDNKGLITTCLVIFLLALVVAIAEEFTNLRKSKPLMLSAGLIWGLIAIDAMDNGRSEAAESALLSALLQYAELMLILLVVMTYINALKERRVFTSLLGWLGNRGYSYRAVFWLTGLVSFFISPFLDNLSTSLLMGALVITIGRRKPHFVTLGCLNVIIAANAGGVFSPFGDITTLMIWQKQIVSPNGVIDFWSFFHLLLPATASFLVPAAAMHFSVPKGIIKTRQSEYAFRRGAKRIIFLFLATIFTSVVFQNILHLPAVVGMFTGFAYLQFFGFYLRKTHCPEPDQSEGVGELFPRKPTDGKEPFDIFIDVAHAEWDTLLFLYGVILSVAGLDYLGFFGEISSLLYSTYGATFTNVSIGLASSILENIPVMSIVLLMHPEMPMGQWLLVTLTVGIGGSLFSIGSAAGIALMGQAKGAYTFFSHLKWAPAILLGYFLAVELHLRINSALF